ncbi:MAG TPA: sulfate adenylyltransferase subunit CysN [Polyangiaceae bacterium LLY-WYZ-15_(1-7)]|nr:sulfate adenylyltransferase subunit CysN [Myxococcales bacterium]MAT25336.1 sulfate adenylyltransferase subunit CysN [Sandaracinus sp.]HJL00611.1 sulfate adenylyltransferase subunit CysN [Polyangiaceae bacterium LLY-WYZ-15_(1-7)]MBJ72236.1 sulfate adenylyltransferase subunit CysN [Sandaracinus sp.]HJL13189.1 sulfate adenylyltransferase subunit CysN [Polyangiaceae bacterium LLY-WYZ-15_(1-7)]
MGAESDTDLLRSDISAYLKKYQAKDLLRFVAVGSVDDGKSTLIGRLLHDTGMVYEDQLEAVKRASNIEGEEIDFSLFTDGLRAEREQGITIDVAYRYFTTEQRKFIIADTPGHIQYTRNMVTGASTANVALILIDARLGVLQQSRRHGFIASLLGIRHLAVCVNKMDLVGYDRQVFERIRAEFTEFAKDLGFKDVTFFPISALKGDNVVGASAKTGWYDGPSVLEYLETVPISEDRDLEHFRLPVQYVVRPNLDYRGFAGQLVGGTLKKGDEVMVLPSGKSSKVRSIDTFDGPLDEAFAPQSVCVRLEDEIDCSRGDMLVHPDDLPTVGRTFDAHVVWMNETPLDPAKTYILKHTTQSVRVQVDGVQWRKDMDTLEEEDAARLELNDIGLLKLSCHRALFYDPYQQNRSTGAFILIDSLTNDTVAAGMVAGGESLTKGASVEDALKEARAGSGLTPKTQVSPNERRERMGQRGAVLWLVGLPGSGRWSLAYALERRLFDQGRTATVVDPTGEDLRSMISAAKACADAGLVCICAFPSYGIEDRAKLRERIGNDRLFEVYVNTDPALCRERRPDVEVELEPPRHPDLTVALDSVHVEDAVDLIIAELEKRHQFRDHD